MTKSAAFEQDMLLLYFNATTHNDFAENDTTSPTANLTIALHTGDPGEGGDQTTSEIAYTGYARVNVARTGGGWSVSAGVATPVAAITFGQMSGGAGGTVTHFSIGSGVTNYMMYSGTVTPNIVVTNGVTPELTTASSVTED